MDARYNRILDKITIEGLTLPNLIAYVLSSPNPNIIYYKNELASNAGLLCSQLITCARDGTKAIIDIAGETYLSEVQALVKRDHGLHFSAATATADQISGFDLPLVAQQMQDLAPQLWALLGYLLEKINQKANYLPGLFGLFLHSCRTPERVITALARIGVSVSDSSIYNSIRNMSRDSVANLRKLGETKLVQYGADNFDVHLKRLLSTLEKNSSTLYHLTSALMMPLQHGVELKDLRCSDELWRKSPLNSFIPLLKDPEPIEQIPVVQTPITPARAMECNNSTVSGNIAALEQLAEQAGIGGPEHEGAVDVSEFVTIVHGDLGTGDRIASILLRRSIEETPWRRFQHIVFVPGLFHLQLACADAIWRITISKPESRRDPTSIMKDVAILHPKHTGTFSNSKVTYRQMTNVINNAGIVRRLDEWLKEANRQGTRSQFVDLNAFAASKPNWSQLQEMAASLAKRINTESQKVTRKRRSPVPDPDRDEQYENSVLTMKYFLLYDELLYAIKHGDIGRVEQVLIPWIFIFKGIGKHKYAFHMQRYLADVHLKYPAGLRHAIRYNILVNPKGKPDGFRGVDWVVELMNLYTKAIYGGEGSNYTVERILKESPLVMIYRDAQNIVERNYLLRKLTTSHSGPNMVASFTAAIAAHAKNQTNEIVPERKSRYVIPDVTDIGRGRLNHRATGSSSSTGRTDAGNMDVDPVDADGDADANVDGVDVDNPELQLEALDIISEIV
ncbi:hypothetical protein BDN72DRAFT_910171 [Pluteus cervinus]|uniref:Uncharacterized protein n=1 Tax=Pluteus cervinus TaxID=181527 RepID=A0ACD3BH84_9AGAR|nr:hypothetical protein BDN72DRAFT_910171 [Pluteus cervinus]